MGADATDSRPLRADARRNRERVLAAALELFAQSGQAAQMDDVARRAGVGVGTVYRHFPTKDALVGELMRRKFVGLAERARALAAVEDPWEAFSRLVRESAEDMAADRSQQTMLWVATEEALAYAADAKAELRVAAGALIDRAVAAGVLRPDFTIDDMPTIMCALGGSMSAHDGPAGDWRRLVDIVLDGLRVPAAPAARASGRQRR